jgi:hypothetical protein
LTHRWGNPDEYKIRLDTSSLAELRDGVLVGALLRTFEDAVHAAMELDVQYLWIDMLCIIQNDEDGWRRESGIMGQIYQNGYLNISAVAASGSTQVLCYPRNPWRIVPWPWLNSEAGDGKIRTPYLVMPAYLWDENVADTELNRRGWILQERILSPRIVYFCKDQVFWECRTIHCAEISPNGGPIGIPSRDSTKMDGKLKPLVPEQSLAQYGQLKIEIISNYWSAVVIMYSKCDLTFGRDKLIALSRIAREVQKLDHTGYMAGMWENQLPHSLMWRVSMATCIHRPQLHVAPSWS